MCYCNIWHETLCQGCSDFMFISQPHLRCSPAWHAAENFSSPPVCAAPVESDKQREGLFWLPPSGVLLSQEEWMRWRQGHVLKPLGVCGKHRGLLGAGIWVRDSGREDLEVFQGYGRKTRESWRDSWKEINCKRTQFVYISKRRLVLSYTHYTHFFSSRPAEEVGEDEGSGEKRKLDW